MSQDIFSSINPDDSGIELAAILNDFKDAIVSGLSGTTRPTELQPGGFWVDTSDDPNTWTFKLWTGVDDVEVFVIDLATGSAAVNLAVDSFLIRKVSADTVGAVMSLVKRRIASNGQVNSGDVVGEIRMIGRDNSAGDPVVAKIIWTAGENQTSSAYGGTLSFMSTPLGTNTLTEHMRFIAGQVEMVVGMKINAEEIISQNVASAATIAQLSAAKRVVEMTGSTATDIQGVNSGHASKVVTIHNRTSVNVTLKHQNGSAAANDRIVLPESKDVVLLPQDSATLYYCTADSRWKLQYASARFGGFTSETIYGPVDEWVAPSTVSKIRVMARARKKTINSNLNFSGVLDMGKIPYSWGTNANGEIGDGTVTNASSPVAAVGGVKFASLSTPLGAFRMGLTEGGDAYAWGLNSEGQLGVGDVTSRSSPVAVLGGLKFKELTHGFISAFGITPAGVAYGWGYNASGQLGNNDVTSRSSPVAVLGGLKFRKIFAINSVLNVSAYGITFDGDLYAWGHNANGQLGVGDVTPRSSPVIVLGGLKFRDLALGSGFAVGVTESNDLYAWGVNGSGQLGLGDTTPRSSPVAVLGGLKALEIKALGSAGSHAMIINDSNLIYAWGSNNKGQLGDGTTTDRSSPVAVVGVAGLLFSKLSGGIGVGLGTGEHSFALTQDGTLYAWGDNSDGELGVGNTVARSSPVAVLGGLVFREIQAPHGMTTDGRLYGWGDNTSGRLGLGDTTPRSSPVAVLGGLSLPTQDDSDTVLDIAVVGGNTYALKLGDGPCFFGSQPLGNNIRQVDISYVS